MKILRNTLFLSIFPLLGLQAKEINLTVINTRSMPIIMNCSVASNPDVGIFGILIDANSQEEYIIPELYWFAKQALGLRGPIKIVDVLNHALPTKLEFVIPNEESQQLMIKPESLTVKISPTSKAPVVTMPKAP